jgi:hypothetical protein
MEKITTTLAGYEHQVFPRNIDELNKTVEQFGQKRQREGRSLNGYDIHYMLGSAIGCKGTVSATTADNYEWFWAAEFNLDGKEVAVLLPCRDKPGQEPGVYGLDRSIAVHYQGEIPIERLEELVEKIQAQFKNWDEQGKRGNTTDGFGY